MSCRSHHSLRLGALALLAVMALWPRTKAAGTAAEVAAAARASSTTHSVAARAETSAARLVSAPRTAKLTVAQTDETQLSN